MAATQKISPLQVSTPKDWAGLTEDNHLSAIYQRDIQAASDIVTQLYNQRGLVGLDTLLNKYQTKVFETDMDYEWDLKGDDRQAISIVSYSSADSTRVGLNKQPFEITLAKRWFVAQDVLGLDDVDHKIIMLNDGETDGTNYKYRAMVMRQDPAYFIPTELLRANRKVMKLYNAVTNTLNDQYTESEFSSQFKLRNSFSNLAQKYTIPGNMHGTPLKIGIPKPDGSGYEYVWTKLQELKWDFDWIMYKSNQLMYSDSLQDINGVSTHKANNGFIIKQGAGLRAQISPSYKYYYNILTLDYLLEAAYALSINILPEDDREFVLMTGERGMIAFSKLIEDKVGIFQPIIATSDQSRVFGTGQNMGFRGQYKQYWGPQGIKFTVMHNSDYDDPKKHRMEDPDGGFTENYRMTLMNIGTSNGKPNIQKCAVKGRSDIKWYVSGSTSPFGPNYSGSGGSAVDGYEVYRQHTQAIMVRNPLSMAELIKNVSYY